MKAYYIVLISFTLAIRAQITPLSVYNSLFEKTRVKLGNSKDDSDMLNTFEQNFYKAYNSRKGSIVSSSLDLEVAAEIDTSVNAFNLDREKGTYAYGVKRGNKIIKVLISGAKGTKAKVGTKEVSTLSLSEAIEENQTSNAIAYASKISDTEYLIDAKINGVDDTTDMNDKGQFVLSRSVGRRFILEASKAAIAIMKTYRLTIGKDYLKFELMLLSAGAAIKPNCVISKSTIKVLAYVATTSNMRVTTNMGLFTSENVTNDKKSVSTHFGFLRIEKDYETSEQKTGSRAALDAKSTDVSGYFLDFLNSYKNYK